MRALGAPFVAMTCLSVTTAFVSTKFTTQNNRNPAFLRLIEADFDFSSKRGWDDYYRQADANETLEWHSSVPFSIQIDLVPRGSSCLIVGCGNSAFPRALYEAHQGDSLITCLDSSSTCLDRLRALHGKDCNMKFICGDAIQLSETLQQDTNLPQQYNVIVDKGLTDAILCDEGWDGPLKRLLTEASAVLTTGGTYILICYRLSDSRMDFLREVGDKVGGLSWSFNVEGTNDHVSVSTATKV